MEIPYKRDNLEWRPVVESPDKYLVSNYGDVIRKERRFIDAAGKRQYYKERIFWVENQSTGGGTNGNNYKLLNIDGNRRYSHRLAAQAFIPNTQNKPEVNHKDGNTFNNYCGCAENNYIDSNLEWVTSKENMEHASRNGLINKISEKRKIQCAINRQKVDYELIKRAVVQIDPLTGDVVHRYKSITDAGSSLGILPQSIEAVVRKEGYHKTAGGFGWIYVEEYNPNADNRIINNQGYNTKAVRKIDLVTNEVLDTYASIKEACQQNNFSGNSYIGEVCNGRRKHYKGFKWEYAE